MLFPSVWFLLGTLSPAELSEYTLISKIPLELFVPQERRLDMLSVTVRNFARCCDS